MSEIDDSKSGCFLEFIIAAISIALGKGLYRILQSSYFKDSLFWNEYKWVCTFICIFFIFGIVKAIQKYLQKESN